MHIPHQYPGHLRFTRNLLAVTAAALFGYRIIRAAHHGLIDALTSAATAAAIVAAVAVGYLIHVRQLRARAEHAELKVIQLRDNLLEGDEDRALWDSVEPAGDDHDTCKFGTKVVALNRWRYPAAG